MLGQEENKDFLADIPSEGGEVNLSTDAPEKKDEASDSPTDKKPVEADKPPQDGDNSPDDKNVPFHKHPRWKAMFEKASKVEGLEQQLSEMRGTIEKLQGGQISATSNERPPEWFVKLYGDNKDAYKIMKEEMFGSFKKELKQEFFDELKKQRSDEENATKEGEKYVKSELQAMRDDGLEFEENELMKFIVDMKDKYGIYPLDDKNRIDFRKAYELMKEFSPAKKDDKKATQNARKSIANFTTKNSSASPNTKGEKDYATAKDLRHTDWRSLID